MPGSDVVMAELAGRGAAAVAVAGECGADGGAVGIVDLITNRAVWRSNGFWAHVCDSAATMTESERSSATRCSQWRAESGLRWA